MKEVSKVNRDEILKAISSLAKCQGFYSRLYLNLTELRMDDPEEYNRVMTQLEEQNFKDSVDLVMYLES